MRQLVAWAARDPDKAQLLGDNLPQYGAEALLFAFAPIQAAVPERYIAHSHRAWCNPIQPLTA